MSRIHILGSCSGTEPQPGRHHTAWVLEHNGSLYWFDAGENCSHTAHLAGLDLLKVRNIFISHPHMDHVGGLANLLWTIRKLTIVGGIRSLEPVTVYTPSLSQFTAVRSILAETENEFKSCFQLDAKKITDGIVLDDGNIRVEARHNLHLGVPENGEWKSFSFRIMASSTCRTASSSDPFIVIPAAWGCPPPPKDWAISLIQSGSFARSENLTVSPSPSRASRAILVPTVSRPKFTSVSACSARALQARKSSRVSFMTAICPFS